MPTDAESYYTQAGQGTTVRAPGFGLPGGGAGDPSMQLMALLGPALAFKRQQAQMQNQLAMRGAEREDASLQAQLNQQALQQRMAQEEQANSLAQQARANGLQDMARRKANKAARTDLSGMEASYVRNVGGMNQVPGVIRSFAGNPNTAFSGWVGKNQTQPQGGGRILLSGSSSGTPFGQPVRNELDEQAAKVRALNMGTDDGGPVRAQGAPAFNPTIGESFRAPQRRR